MVPAWSPVREVQTYLCGSVEHDAGISKVALDQATNFTQCRVDASLLVAGSGLYAHRWFLLRAVLAQLPREVHVT